MGAWDARQPRRSTIAHQRGLAERKLPIRTALFYLAVLIIAILAAWVHHH